MPRRLQTDAVLLIPHLLLLESEQGRSADALLHCLRANVWGDVCQELRVPVFSALNIMDLPAASAGDVADMLLEVLCCCPHLHAAQALQCDQHHHLHCMQGCSCLPCHSLESVCCMCQHDSSAIRSNTALPHAPTALPWPHAFTAQQQGQRHGCATKVHSVSRRLACSEHAPLRCRCCLRWATWSCRRPWCWAPRCMTTLCQAGLLASLALCADGCMRLLVSRLAQLPWTLCASASSWTKPAPSLQQSWPALTVTGAPASLPLLLG